MDDELDEQKQYTSFEKYQDFVKTQEALLKADLYCDPTPEEEQKEYAQYNKLNLILQEYQEQSYLLDPFLEKLVTPVLDLLRAHAKDVVSNRTLKPSSPRLERVALLLYGYIRQFDDGESGKTAKTIERIAKDHLGKAGLEREGAAILLSRLYMRQDTSVHLNGFLEWANSLLQTTSDPFVVTGVLQVLAEILKSAPPKVAETIIAAYEPLVTTLEGRENLLVNTIVRKLKSKITSRVGIRLLPGSVSRRKGRTLSGSDVSQSIVEEDDIDVPEEEEAVLERLFAALQDRDTVVRWSAAKGVARISERLPSDFTEQVLDTILGLFSIHYVPAASLYDVSPIAEGTWHGACLSCAEMARRGLIPSARLTELIGWLSKALYFDIRRGAHSIGSSVRDASAYVLWALARSQNLSDLVPYAIELARHLVTVSLFDREVHIRRAASAAFQEFVGRTSLFPHGIDVLAKTDFYAIGVRRNAFLVAAPQVAEHEEYNTFLLDHLLNVTLRHWDASMRRLASQSLRLICLRNLVKFGPEGIARATKLSDSPDISDLHGCLLALAEIAKAYETAETPDLEKEKCDIFERLNRIPEKTLLEPRNDILLAAGCGLIESTITLREIKLENKSSVPNWRKIVEQGLKSRNIHVQEAATAAMGAMSSFHFMNASEVDYSFLKLTLELKRGSFMAQQCLGRLLGVVNYEKFPACLNANLKVLLNCVDRSSGPFRSNIEARRNCYQAFALIVQNIAPRLTTLLHHEIVNSLLDALLDGLRDYSVDERGDVGSWVRIASLCSLGTIAEILLKGVRDLPLLGSYLPPPKFQQVLQGILKQGVERLDNVRVVAGQVFRNLLSATSEPGFELWSVHNSSLLAELFLGGEAATTEWNDAGWLFPRAVRILDIKAYRMAVLLGFISSIGSLTESTQRPAATSLVSYVKSLPHKSPDISSRYDVVTFVDDMFKHARANITSNVVMLPVLQVFNVILEGEALDLIRTSKEGVEIFRSFLTMICKNADRLKSVKRVHESFKVAVNSLIYPEVFDDCVKYIPQFLAHQYPTVRANAAEYLYLGLQRMDLGRETDDAEEVILETEWSSLGLEDAKKMAVEVVSRLAG